MSAKRVSDNHEEDQDRTESFSSVPVSEVVSRRTETFRPILICMNGTRRGVRYKLDRRETVVGRSRECDFQVSDNGTSRQHVRIVYENFDRVDEIPRCYVEDLGSRNGTQVNARGLHGRQALNERDRVTVGRTILGFFFRDEDELLHDEHLYEHATRDAVTGLDNRRQLLSHLKHYIGLASRSRSPISLVVLDLDFFKRVNDTHGHQMGDDVLRFVGEILVSRVRDSDLVARWGGEEFAVCLPETTVENARLFAERVRSDMEASTFERPGITIKLTASLGVSQYRVGDDAETLFGRADAALYAAKNAGRNRVVVDGDFAP